jgi:hypothetical protein
VTWPPYPNQSTNAPFAIYDGSTLLQTVLVDQTQKPVGNTYGGAVFQKIATVTISNGPLKVVLSNTNTNNTYIVANAVRFSPVGKSSTDLNWSNAGDGVSGPSSVAPGASFTISRQYTVGGATAPSNFAIAYYASTSNNPNQNLNNAIFLGTESISGSGLNVGDHAGNSPSFQINANGVFYLIGVLNANNDFLESDSGNDTNDIAVSTSTTTVNGPVIIANGQSGYAETGSWTTESVSGDYGGTDRYASSSGNGNNTATWQTSGPAGQYSIEITWPPFSNQATNAPFAIYDGTTLLTTVYIDQTQKPVGNTYGGAVFQKVATVTTSTTTLKVVVSNTNTNRAYIIANAVRFAPVSKSNTDLSWSNPGDGVSGPASVAPGASFNISRQFTVSGATAPSNFAIAYYASTSNNPNQNLSNAIFLGTEQISGSGLNVGDHAGTSPAFQINANGVFYLLGVLNSNNDFLESDSGNDTNDIAVSSSTTTVSGPIIIANGQSGYSDVGGWTTESQSGDYGGTDRYASAAGNGNNTATWTFTEPPGKYTVEIAWLKYSNQATNAPFAIYDGNTLLTTILVDETQSPVGSVYGGATFQLVATVNISTSTLSVVLSNTNTNNTYIVANAVRIAPG